MKKSSFISLFHTILIILAWASPFYLDWKLILAVEIILSLQYIFFGGCTLTNMQFSKKAKAISNNTMYSYYLQKLGFKPNKIIIKFIARYIFPLLILLFSIVWQIILKHPIIIKF